jgi:hypothetical protein
MNILLSKKLVLVLLAAGVLTLPLSGDLTLTNTGYWIIIIGLIRAYYIIFKEKGWKRTFISLWAWVLVALFIVFFLTSDGLDGLAWVIPIYVSVPVALINTIFTLFHKKSS